MSALPHHVDVIVVGAGLPGLAAAQRLRQGGAEVLVLERRPGPLQGVSGRGHGLAWAGLPEHPWRIEASLGRDEASALYRFASEGLDALAALGALRRTGMVWASTETTREPSEVERSVEALARLGLRVTALDATGVARATGAVGLGPGFHRPEEGEVDLERLHEALALPPEALRTGVEVLALGVEGDALSVHTPLGVVRGHALVLAAEAGLRTLHPFFGDTLSLVREQALVVAGGPTLHTPLRAGFGWTVARRVGPDTLVAGCRWASPHLEEGEADETLTSPAVQARLEGFAATFLPGTGPVLARRAWIQAHGCDGLPLIGPLPDNPRIAVCAGFAGHESTLGVRAGLAVAEGLLTGRAEGVPRCLSSQRFLA